MTKCDFCQYSDFNEDTHKLECRYGLCQFSQETILKILSALRGNKK